MDSLHEELDTWKEAAFDFDKLWKAAGKPRFGPVFCIVNGLGREKGQKTWILAWLLTLFSLQTIILLSILRNNSNIEIDFSKTSSNWTSICLFKGLINGASWFTLSKALDRSIVHKAVTQSLNYKEKPWNGIGWKPTSHTAVGHHGPQQLNQRMGATGGLGKRWINLW